MAKALILHSFSYLNLGKTTVATCGCQNQIIWDFWAMLMLRCFSDFSVDLSEMPLFFWRWATWWLTVGMFGAPASDLESGTPQPSTGWMDFTQTCLSWTFSILRCLYWLIIGLYIIYIYIYDSCPQNHFHRFLPHYFCGWEPPHFAGVRDILRAVPFALGNQIIALRWAQPSPRWWFLISQILKTLNDLGQFIGAECSRMLQMCFLHVFLAKHHIPTSFFHRIGDCRRPLLRVRYSQGILRGLISDLARKLAGVAAGLEAESPTK